MEWHISVSMRILIYYRHRAPWCWKSYWNEKSISTWYENGKESTNQRGRFLNFYRFSWSYAGPKSNLHPRKKISLFGVTNPEIIYMLLLFQIICIHWFFKKSGCFDRKFNGTYMDRKQPFGSFLKMDAWSS